MNRNMEENCGGHDERKSFSSDDPEKAGEISNLLPTVKPAFQLHQPLPLSPQLPKKDSKYGSFWGSRPGTPKTPPTKDRSDSNSTIRRLSGQFMRIRSASGHVLHSDHDKALDQLLGSGDQDDDECKHEDGDKNSPVKSEAQSVTAENSPEHEMMHLHEIHGLETINEDDGESAILEDLERKVGFGGLGGSGTTTIVDFASLNNAKTTVTQGSAPNNAPLERGRSASTMHSPHEVINRARMMRKNSQDSVEYIGFDGATSEGAQGLRYIYRKLMSIIYYLTPDFYYRLNVYLMIFFLLVIAMIAQRNKPIKKLVLLYVCTIGLEFGTSLFDRVVFRIIDYLFESRFDVAYQMHSINGPLGLLITVYVMRGYWDELLDARALFPDWNNFVTSAAVIVICLAGKNWFTRKQYIHLLESRFAPKVENLNTMIIILSELASTRPPKSVQLQKATLNLAKRTSSTNNSSGSGALHATTTMAAKVKNVFADIVDTTPEEESQEEVITRKALFEKRRSFWQSAARLNATAGRMKVITYNGIVNIYNQKQAKEFGKKLFKHLSKGGKVVITPDLIRKLFEERREIVNRDLDEKAEHDQAMAEIIVNEEASKALYENEDERQDLWVKTVTMFDPFNLGRISQDFCAEAVLNIYKEQRFTAASISDFGELHQSLRIGIDILYWVVMAFVLQGILGFDLASYILPFISIFLSFSFAIAPLVGNVFLAFAFVFFMSPFEVGHKVQIGLVSSSIPPPVGFVKSVSLLYTILNTTKNETIKIPNHTLYGEKVFNLSETTGATHDFTISFNIFGSTHTEMDKIKEFFTRLKHYTLRESKEWKSFFLTASAFDTTNNNMEYKVYCTHREGWGFVQAVCAAKIEYYFTIKRLREEMGLSYYKAKLPVAILPAAIAYATGDSSNTDPATATATTEILNPVSSGAVQQDGLRNRNTPIVTDSLSDTGATTILPTVTSTIGYSAKHSIQHIGSNDSGVSVDAFPIGDCEVKKDK